MDSKVAILSLSLIILIQNYAAAVDIHDDLVLDLILRVEGLENKVRQQDHQLLTLESTVDSQGEELTDLRYRVQAQNKHIAETNVARERRATRPVHVAFSAYLDHQINHVGIDAIIPFDKTVINDFSGYNNYTGVFTVPVDGVYLFTYMVNTLDDVWQLVVKLVVDGVNISDATSDPKHDLQEVQGGNTVIVRVKQGQSVWLAAYNTADTIVDGREQYRFSTLSGFLLYQ